MQKFRRWALGAELDTYARVPDGCVPAKLTTSGTKHEHSLSIDSLRLNIPETPFPFHSSVTGKGKSYIIVIDRLMNALTSPYPLSATYEVP